MGRRGRGRGRIRREQKRKGRCRCGCGCTEVRLVRLGRGGVRNDEKGCLRRQCMNKGEWQLKGEVPCSAALARRVVQLVLQRRVAEWQTGANRAKRGICSAASPYRWDLTGRTRRTVAPNTVSLVDGLCEWLAKDALLRDTLVGTESWMCVFVGLLSLPAPQRTC